MVCLYVSFDAFCASILLPKMNLLQFQKIKFKISRSWCLYCYDMIKQRIVISIIKHDIFIHRYRFFYDSFIVIWFVPQNSKLQAKGKMRIIYSVNYKLAYRFRKKGGWFGWSAFLVGYLDQHWLVSEKTRAQVLLSGLIGCFAQASGNTVEILQDTHWNVSVTSKQCTSSIFSYKFKISPIFSQSVTK